MCPPHLGAPIMPWSFLPVHCPGRVARAHGGDVVLVNRSGGGLTAEIVLPVAAAAAAPALSSPQA
jgi:hypothetical protein